MTSIPEDYQENEIYLNLLRIVFGERSRMCNACSQSEKVTETHPT